MLAATGCGGRYLADEDTDATPGADAGPPGTDASADARPASDGATGELLTISFDTTPNGGEYAPRNVVAVWAEDAGGAFVKTIGRWAAVRKNHLVAWTAAAGPLDADAVSGATRLDHAVRLTLQWDLTDLNDLPIADGSYTIRMELADQNSTLTAQNHQATFTFTKDGQAATQTGANGGFLNVSLDYSGR